MAFGEFGDRGMSPEVNVSASRIYAAEGQCFVLAPCGVVSPESGPKHIRPM